MDKQFISGNRTRRPVKRMDICINMDRTGANIRRLIKASGYSVKDIMEITGISTEQAVYKWYRGESIPSIETQLILCKVLDIDITELLVIDGEFNFLREYLFQRNVCKISVFQHIPAKKQIYNIEVTHEKNIMDRCLRAQAAYLT